MHKPLSTRGQEEIAGFVLVVVIVTIVAVVFIVFSASTSQTRSSVSSIEAKQFLESVLQTTSDCIISRETPAQLSELLISCYQRHENECKSEGRSIRVCEALNTSMINILSTSWPVGAEHPISGYIFEAQYLATGNKTTGRMIVNLNKGNCTSAKRTGEYALREPKTRGTIVSSFTLCST